MYRGNTEISKVYRGNTEFNKVYRGNSLVWENIVAYSIDFLVIAAGGSAGGVAAGFPNGGGGGGGAGGLRTSYGSTSGGGASNESQLTFNPGVTYTITVGGGIANSNGSNSSLSGADITTITSLGGGRAGDPTQGSISGATGGSGGGGSSNSTSVYAGGSGTSNQGYGGGSGFRGYNAIVSGDFAGGGAGGGAGGAAITTPTNVGNPSYTAGAGLQVGITGTSTYYAAGGMGYAIGKTGGGTGWTGAANSGDGAERSGNYSVAGNSGVVILRLPTANYTGTTTGSPTVTTDGDYTILKFTGSGTYTA
jgi:hypothetical protein